MIRFMTVCLVFFALTSCSKMKLSRQLKAIVGKEMAIPYIESAVVAGKDSMVQTPNNAMVKMIVFYDSVGCSSCKVSHMYEWEEFVALSRGTRGKFTPVFIFSPANGKRGEVVLALKTYKFDWPVFLDPASSFSTANPFIPADSRFHVFLLDKNNRVILVGNPLGNASLMKLYRSTITELIANDGISPAL